jgi:UDP-glucose 4-epimerase
MTNSIGIIGANGFLGRSMSSHFSLKDCELDLIDRDKFNKILVDSMYESIAQNDYLFWLATSVNPMTAQSNISLMEKDLHDFEKFLLGLRQSRRETPIAVVLASSGGCVYSGSDSPFSEESEALGSNAYGRFKRAQEKILESSGIPNVIVRASNVYGPGQPIGKGQGVIAEWIEAKTRFETVKLYGDISATRDFLYIDDFLGAIEKIMAQKILGTINIGSGIPTSLGDVLKCIDSLTDTPLQVDYLVQRDVDRKDYSLNISKAKNILGWTPKISLAEGIKRTHDFKSSGTSKL